METRTVEVSLAKAKEWYKSKNTALKEVALQAFTEQELKAVSFKDITTLEQACKALNMSFTKVRDNFKTIEAVSKHSAYVYLLDIIRRALNGDEDMKLTKGDVYYPWVRFYPENSLPTQSKLDTEGWKLAERFTNDGKAYRLVGGDYNFYFGNGVGYFNGGFGYVHANAGLLGCKSREIAKHMSYHFAKYIFQAVYAQHNFVDWTEL